MGVNHGREGSDIKSGNKSQEGHECIIRVGANHGREVRMHLEWEPITGGKCV